MPLLLHLSARMSYVYYLSTSSGDIPIRDFQTKWSVFLIEIYRVTVNILRGHSVGHSKQKSVYVHVSYSERFHCTDEQHALSSHELRSALMLTVEFSKMYYTR
jgi:hypothetical protein